MQLTCPHCQQVLQFSGKRPAFCAYCGKSLPSPDEARTVAFDGAGLLDDETPSEVGGYRLLRLLGAGGMGRVYEAEEAASGRRVALKLIAAEFAASSAAIERFRREGRLASCVAHPRCVFVLAADEADGRPYIVMELMPGATLQDVVNRDGPLPVEQALSKILDVIDGLREAHRLGVIHRDVKPSNCFVEADGRVKIGDFGLSKSLVGGDALTRTGTFLGTPLFASPEQIKSETVGPQSDVYSVAATLYCLLTGRAPFQGGDPAATLARIVSEAAPPMRSLRPDLPAALDKVVLRGLERDRAKRWRDLDEFRTALLPFVPGRLSIGGLGVRFGAFLIDYAVLMVPGFAVGWLIVAMTGGGSPWDPQMRMDQLFQLLAGSLLGGLYFGGCEALWGCTPGKRLLGLRVCKAKGGERPSVAAVTLRTGLFYLLLNLGTFAVAVLLLSGAVDPLNPAPEQQIRLGLLLTATFYLLWALGIVLILCTMRARNGYRGMHEVLSGTRVVLLPYVVRDRTLRGRDLKLETSPPEGLPGRIGSFEVLGVLPSAGTGRLLLGDDASLGRSAWIWLRPADDPPLSPARRELSRTTRLRWLAGGREGEFQWDAFLAPDGGVFTAAAPSAGRLSWGETRRLLGQLTDELAEAEADGTLPATLTTGQVWVRPDGRVHLLDVAVSAEPADAPADSRSQGLSLLARTAVLALEGELRPANERPAGVRAPVPRHASDMLGRLLGVGAPYVNVREFRAALAASAEKPVETTRQRRLAHLAVLTAFLSFGLCAGLSPVALSPPLATVSASFRIRQMEGLRERLAEVAPQDAADLEKADPANRQIALRHSGEDARLDEALGRTLERTRRERQARLDAMSWLGRGYAKAIEKQVQDPQDAQGRPLQLLPPASKPDTVHSMAERYATGNDGEKNETIIVPWTQTVLLLLWPVAWILWAFLTRGGLTFLLMGLSLVRGNGRPALRVQCAWRALLVWAPVTGLAVASVWLSASYWSHWTGDGSDGWMLWASSAAWWASLALLPLYVALALVFPRRAPHDWLAGTYLVPR
jgi:eukaryotic-like serine/threonine-protein kinase